MILSSCWGLTSIKPLDQLVALWLTFSSLKLSASATNGVWETSQLHRATWKNSPVYICLQKKFARLYLSAPLANLKPI